MDKYLCERCGKELVFRCAYSKIDHKLICAECDDKEQPKKLMKKIVDLETKLADSEEDLQATKESLYASREYLEELKSEKWGLEKALELAVKELDDAKDMLRECNKNEWASLLNTSVDYFKARGKEVENDRK